MSRSGPVHRLLALLLAALLPGCLSSSYVIPRDDARALVQRAPEQRGADVRVVQRIFADEPASAPSVSGTTPILLLPQARGAVSVSGGFVGGVAVGGGGGVRAVGAAPAVTGGSVGVQPAPGNGTVGVQPAAGGNVAATGAVRGGSGGGVSSGSEGGGGGGGDDGLAVVLLIAASVAVALVLAGTEGARYDGWAQLHPMHPVHVLGQDGSATVVPLAQLDAATVEASDELLVSEDEGPFLRLGRAPLDRVGLVYGMEVGLATLRGPRGALGPAFASHIQLGAFPLHGLGLLFDVQLGVGDADGKDIVNAQLSGEVQALPLAFGLLELGVYGRVGGASPAQRGDDWGLAAGGGLLAQLAVTTRLALTLRGGASWVRDAREDVVVGEGTFGVAVY